MTRRGDLRARQLVRQVAAGVGRRRVELQYRKRQVVELGHADIRNPCAPVEPCSRASASIGLERVKIPGPRNIRIVYQLCHAAREFAPRDLARTERSQQRRVHLAVDQAEPPGSRRCTSAPARSWRRRSCARTWTRRRTCAPRPFRTGRQPVALGTRSPREWATPSGMQAQ